MSRYIDADAIKRELQVWATNLGNPKWFGKDEAEIVIDFAPSIDIVRCVDCRKCKEQGGYANCNGYLYCTRQKTMVDEDCFCSWGEER